jgi:hypothetical protein
MRYMDDNPAEKIEPAGDEKLRLAEPDPLPVASPQSAPAVSAEADAPEKVPARRFRQRETRRRVEDESRSINWGPIVVALVIILAAGAGLWRWRTVELKRKAAAAVVESPLEYHKRQFLAALRGDGTNAVPMQVRADRMRFHQRVLLSHGFLAERKFVFTNGAAKARVSVNRIEGVSMEYAMVEPRGKDVLAVIAPRDDMPAWESVMRLAGAK